jgi:hypothetical protein
MIRRGMATGANRFRRVGVPVRPRRGWSSRVHSEQDRPGPHRRDDRRRVCDEDSVSLRSLIGMSHEGGWSDSEADRSGASVKALVPHRDCEICRAECKRTGEMYRVSPAELMSYCKRAGSSLDVG